MLWAIGMVAVGLVALTAGGEALVWAAVRLARRLGLPPHLIGITIVAAGTSLPELVVSADASMRGMPDLAIGNVVGSNIYNVAFILGLCALVRPLAVARTTLDVDLPVLLFASVGLLLTAADGGIGRLEAGAMLLAYVAYVAMQVRTAPREAADEIASIPPWRIGLGLVVGFALLAGGARVCVDGAVELATYAGISERVIGLTVVAIGTSLPELFASLAATWRGHDDLAVGNLVGSNVFNILAILGVSGLVNPLTVGAQFARWDLPAMMVVAVVLVPVFVSGQRVSRGEGALLLGTSGAYTASLIG